MAKGKGVHKPTMEKKKPAAKPKKAKKGKAPAPSMM